MNRDTSSAMMNEINAARAANGLAPLPMLTFTAEQDAALCAFAHEQAHAARAIGAELTAQAWEHEAFKIEPPVEFRGPRLVSYEIVGALPVRLPLPVLCF